MLLPAWNLIYWTCKNYFAFCPLWAIILLMLYPANCGYSFVEKKSQESLIFHSVSKPFNTYPGSHRLGGQTSLTNCFDKYVGSVSRLSPRLRANINYGSLFILLIERDTAELISHFYLKRVNSTDYLQLLTEWYRNQITFFFTVPRFSKIYISCKRANRYWVIK